MRNEVTIAENKAAYGFCVNRAKSMINLRVWDSRK